MKELRFGRAICGDPAAAERREWWIGNGRGGYAGGTVALTLTRRYHGLLIAPVDPPLGRVLVFAKADATVIEDDGRSWPLFTNRWASGAVAPQGILSLESFHLDGPVPVWHFAIAGRIVEHRIWMEPGADTTYAAWQLDGEGPPLGVSVALLVNGRDHHGDSAPEAFRPEVVADGPMLTVTAARRFALRIRASGGSIAARGDWYHDFDLPLERERGLADRDSHFHAGDALLSMTPGEWVGVTASLDPDADADLDAALARRRACDRAVLDRAVAADPVFAQSPGWVNRLVLASDFYIISRPLEDMPDGQSVIAGYPWFGDWARDTMIALPGLCLATGRFDTARRVLETFARFEQDGLLPNVFHGAGAEPQYNSVDAALWYVEAWRAYVAATDDAAALRHAFPVLARIIERYANGTRYGIGVDATDGLVHAGEEGVQLTWMDARVGDWVVTPRIGKPVEINALWYNALNAMTVLAKRIGAEGEGYRGMAARARQGFARFLLPGAGGLYDVLDGPHGADPSLRPNQILAVSLPASPLDPATQRAVLARCAAALKTSYGLRSLAPDDANYRGIYAGGVVERDGSYHQGPVWAWLLGHWALAYYRVYGDAAGAQRCLEPIGDHLADAGLGQISEIFDGDPPHLPRGCPAQAWSLACVLEAWWRLEREKTARRARRSSSPRRTGGAAHRM